jgi:hypothetical protein
MNLLTYLVVGLLILLQLRITVTAIISQTLSQNLASLGQKSLLYKQLKQLKESQIEIYPRWLHRLQILVQ